MKLCNLTIHYFRMNPVTPLEEVLHQNYSLDCYVTSFKSHWLHFAKKSTAAKNNNNKKVKNKKQKKKSNNQIVKYTRTCAVECCAAYAQRILRSRARGAKALRAVCLTRVCACVRLKSCWPSAASRNPLTPTTMQLRELRAELRFLCAKWKRAVKCELWQGRRCASRNKSPKWKRNYDQFAVPANSLRN